MPVPVGLADDLVDAALVGPACRDALDAGTAAVDEDHVGVLGTDFVEAPHDRGGVAHVLAAGDRREGTLAQVGLGLAVRAWAHDVVGVDGGGSELAGLARAVRSVPGTAWRSVLASAGLESAKV